MPDIVETIALTIRLLNIIVGILLFTFGIIGNFLSIFIFTRSSFRNASSVHYLIASSIANLIQLIQTLLPRILTDGFGIPMVNSNSQYCQARTFLSAVATLCSLTYPCWASFDQYATTSRNATTRQNWTSKRFVYRAIAGTIIFWSIIFSPITITNRAVGELCLGTNIFVTYIYSLGVIPITYSVFPVVAVCYFNVGIVRNLRRSNIAACAHLNNRLAKQVRRMLFPQLIIIVLSGIPLSIQSIYSIATLSVRKDSVRLSIENLMLNIARLLFYIIYACSFYIYLLMSNEIRKEFKKLFCKPNSILPNITMVAGRNTVNSSI